MCGTIRKIIWIDCSINYQSEGRVAEKEGEQGKWGECLQTVTERCLGMCCKLSALNFINVKKLSSA